MTTIEERAKDFADKGLPNNIEGTIRYTYIYAANEQQKIDIEKACEWLSDYDNIINYKEGSYGFDMENFIKNFRKFMNRDTET